MKRSYYIFTPGQLKRKQNTLFFHPYENTNIEPVEDITSNGVKVLTDTGESKKEFDRENKRVIPIDDVDSLMIFTEINFNIRFLDFLTRHKIPAHLFNYYGHYNLTYYPRDYLLSGFLLVEQVTHYKQSAKRVALGQRSHYPHDPVPSQWVSHHEGILQELCEGTLAAPFPQDRVV